MKPDVKAFFDKATYTVSYVVKDPGSDSAAIIDSVLDYDPKSGRTDTTSADAIIAYVKENGLKVEWQLETHAHADHLSAAPYIQKALGGTTAIGSNITPPPSQSGNRPPQVVAVVSRIGRSLRWQASMMARFSGRPFCVVSMLIRSSRTIALLMTMPESEMIPRNVMKPK